MPATTSQTNKETEQTITTTRAGVFRGRNQIGGTVAVFLNDPLVPAPGEARISRWLFGRKILKCNWPKQGTCPIVTYITDAGLVRREAKCQK